jgi:hypothetical protein
MGLVVGPPPGCGVAAVPRGRAATAWSAIRGGVFATDGSQFKLFWCSNWERERSFDGPSWFAQQTNPEGLTANEI